MRFLLLACLFLSSELAMSQDQLATMKFLAAVAAEPASVTPMAPEVANEDGACINIQEVTDADWAKPERLAGIFAALLVVLKYLADILGIVALTGNGSALVAARGVGYAIALLSWFIGKMGWSTPSIEQVKSLPKWSDWKTQNAVKPPSLMALLKQVLLPLGKKSST